MHTSCSRCAMLLTVCWRHWCSTDNNGRRIHVVGPAELPSNETTHVVSAFLELAIERFDARFAAHASDEEERSTLNHLQVMSPRDNYFLVAPLIVKRVVCVRRMLAIGDEHTQETACRRLTPEADFAPAGVDSFCCSNAYICGFRYHGCTCWIRRATHDTAQSRLRRWFWTYNFSTDHGRFFIILSFSHILLRCTNGRRAVAYDSKYILSSTDSGLAT